jgi:hypothetical protein
MKELVTTDKKEVALYESDGLMPILSSLGLPGEFKVIKELQLQKIAEGMVDVYRNKSVFGRKNSQITGRYMTLQMLREGPYNAIKQCDAQIDHRREAIKENTFRLARLKIEIEELEEKITEEPNKYRVKEMELDIIKKRMDLADATVHVEHSLREVLLYIETKKEIKEAHNIPDNFDEEDYIKAEVEENVKTAFLIATRDVEQSGRFNVGISEYFFQFGINPMIAISEIMDYLKSLTDKSDITDLYNFLDRMCEKYKGEISKAAKRVGIKGLMVKDSTYIEESRIQDRNK